MKSKIEIKIRVAHGVNACTMTLETTGELEWDEDRVVIIEDTGSTYYIPIANVIYVIESPPE